MNTNTTPVTATDLATEAAASFDNYPAAYASLEAEAADMERTGNPEEAALYREALRALPTVFAEAHA